MKKINTEKRIYRVLDEVMTKISLGYTHDNFCEINQILKDLEVVLDENEVLALKEAWRDSYTDSCNQKNLEKTINRIKSRF